MNTESTWFHNAGEQDILEGLEYTEDSQLVLQDVCNGTYENAKIHTNTRKQNKLRTEEKMMKELEKKENAIGELPLSTRKKNMFKESHQVFTKLRLKKMNQFQKEVVDRAEELIDQWTNFETLVYEAESEIIEKKKRKKRETDKSCCKQLKVSRSGNDPNFPPEHLPYFDDIFTLQAEGANGFNFYRGKIQKDGKRNVLKHCLNQPAWVFTNKTTELEKCEGSFYFPSDTTCPETMADTGWHYANDIKGAWPVTTLKIKVECYEEPEENNEISGSDEPEPEDDFESPMLDDFFRLLDQLDQVSTYVENGKNKPRCSVDAEDAFKIAEQLVTNLEHRLESMTVEDTVKRRQTIVDSLKYFLAQQSPETYPEVTLPTNYEPPFKKCFIDWGRALLNDVLEDVEMDTMTPVDKATDCLEHCKDTSEGTCVAWTYDEEAQACYLKSRDMATRESETWESHLWSGNLDLCVSDDVDIKWKRQCNMAEYFRCITPIHVALIGKGETNEGGSHLNNITPSQRLKYDTFNEEINCLIDFCPWTPEIDMESKSNLSNVF